MYAQNVNNETNGASLMEVQHRQMVVLQKQGTSERDTSQKIGCKKTAVHQAIVKFRNFSKYDDLKGGGRPLKLL